MSLFNIKNNQVVIEPDVLPIPEFKALWDRDTSKTKDTAYKELSYVFYVVDFNSPYAGTDERRREELVIKDFIKDETWKPDPEVVKAMEKYRALTETPLMRLVNSVKFSLDKMASYLRETEVDDNTVKTINDTISKVATTAGSYFKLQEAARKESSESSRVIGNKKVNDYER